MKTDSWERHQSWFTICLFTEGLTILAILSSFPWKISSVLSFENSLCKEKIIISGVWLILCSPRSLTMRLGFMCKWVYWGDNPKRVRKWGKEQKKANRGCFISRLTLWTTRIQSGLVLFGRGWEICPRVL